MKHYLLAFVIGSSLVSTFVTFGYLSYYVNLRKKSFTYKPFPYELFPFIIPIMIGIVNVLNVCIVLNTKRNRLIPFLVGAISGILFSFIGRFGFDLPRKLFHFKPNREWIVHVMAMVIYGFVFGIIVNYFNSLFIEGYLQN
eukprot:175871_1